MSGADRPDGHDPLLQGPLAEIFAEEADDDGFERLIEAARSGRLDALTDDERAIIADFEEERARWNDAGLTVDLGPAPAPPGLTPTPPRRARSPARWWLAGALAVAAAALVFTLWPRPPAPSGWQAKGGFDLHVTVVRPGGLAPVEPGARLAAGDRIGLAASSDRPGHLYVYAIGDDGPVRLHPGPDGESAFAAGDDVPLPAGAALTPVAAPTCEYLVGVFAAEPLPAGALDAALRAAHRGADASRCSLGEVELSDASIEAIGVRR